MRNVFMLTLANIRKRKSQSIGLLLFMLIAVMFMNIGLVMSFGIGAFFDKRAEELNAEHFVGIYAAGAASVKEGRAFAENYKGVSEIEVIDAVGGWGDFIMNGNEYISLLMLKCVSESQSMSPPTLIGEHLPLIDDAIYVPYFMLLEGNFRLGDDLKMKLAGNEITFKIAGATEEITFGSLNNSFHRFYISDEKYTELQKQFPESGVTLLSVRMKNIDDVLYFYDEYTQNVSQTDTLYIFHYELTRMVRATIPTIAAVFITAFSGILLVVSLIVIRFRIINSIEESMTNIGAQKAVGYRSVQIISAIVMQFALIALIGGVPGIALSQAAIPPIINLLMPILALPWNPGFDIFSSVISIAVVLFAVTLISFLSAQGINKLHPLIALRGGITTHSFRQNPLPLHKSRISLNLALSLKQILRNKKQAVTISVIIALVSMMSVAAIAVNYNMNEGREGFVSAVFGEMPEVAVMLKNPDDGEAFKEKMLGNPDVRQCFGYQASPMQLLIDEKSASATVAEDCSLLESNMIINGRYPKHSNEIAIGTAIAKVTGKTTGNTVTVRIGESEKEFLVSGVIQQMNEGGFNALLTADALREIQPDFIFGELNIYLHDGVDTVNFVEAMRAEDGALIEMVINVKIQLETMFESIGAIFAAVAIGIVAVTGLIIILVLYMVIKTTILRRRRELGIQKAVGFTTLQLMNQTALNMTPIILIGVVIGAVAGYFGFSPMMGAMMSGFGIVRIDLPAPVGQIIAVSIALIVLAYAVSMLIAMRIRKISAYALVSE